jgi:hypothetical protein
MYRADSDEPRVVAERDGGRAGGAAVTCLIPGPTETAFFECADMLNIQVG